MGNRFVRAINITILFVGFTTGIQAMNLQEKSRGWFWYEDKEKKAKKLQKKTPEILKEDGKSTPTELVMAHRKLLDAKKHKALVSPTVENVADYLYMQKATMDRTFKFQESWQSAVYLNPDLDPSQKDPVSVAGLRVSYEKKMKKREAALRKLSKKSGLFFFYSSNCAYCHKFAPTVKAFAKKYGFKVVAISADGKKMGVFKNERKNNGILESLGITSFPTLVALDTKTKNMIRITSGIVTEDELSKRTVTLLAHFNGGKTNE